MTQPLPEYVTLAVRDEARRQGVSQRRIAQQLGLSQTQIWERMNGRIEWRTSELDQVAAILRVPVTAFLPPADITAGSGPTHPGPARPSAPPPPKPAKGRRTAA